MGSTSLIVDVPTGSATAQVVQRQYSKPYGENIQFTTGGSLTSIGYTGQRQDTESGLMFYNARYYDPVLSFFISADTVAPNPADPKTRNRYSYVLNNPLVHVDPTGHEESSEEQRSWERWLDDILNELWGAMDSMKDAKQQLDGSFDPTGWVRWKSGPKKGQIIKHYEKVDSRMRILEEEYWNLMKDPIKNQVRINRILTELAKLDLWLQGKDPSKLPRTAIDSQKERIRAQLDAYAQKYKTKPGDIPPSPRVQVTRGMEPHTIQEAL